MEGATAAAAAGDDGIAASECGTPLVAIVTRHEVGDADMLATQLHASQYVAVESGHCYGLVLRCSLQEVRSQYVHYRMTQGHTAHLGIWVIEFERGRHYVVVGPAVRGQPKTPLLDIMVRVERDRHGRDPIYQTPVWTDPVKDAELEDLRDPRTVGMPLDPHRTDLRIVSIFDILDDWSLSDLLRESRYIAVKDDWRSLGPKLSLQRAARRGGFWLRRYPEVVGVYLGDAKKCGEYTFIGPSGGTVPATPLPRLLVQLQAALLEEHATADRTLHGTLTLQHAGSEDKLSEPLVEQRGAWLNPKPHGLWALCCPRVSFCCWGAAAVEASR